MSFGCNGFTSSPGIGSSKNWCDSNCKFLCHEFGDFCNGICVPIDWTEKNILCQCKL